MNFINCRIGYTSRKQLRKAVLACCLFAITLNVYSIRAEGLDEGNPDGTPTAEQDAENDKDLARFETQDDIEVTLVDESE